MGALTIELPSQGMQTAFNLRRWLELLRDPELARFEGRVETDRHGHIIMSPPPAASHGSYQFRIGALLDRLMPAGRVLTECPISTADGVKAADVAWASPDRMRDLGDNACFPRAPEICVEVLSPGNTGAEIREKTALYFDAGAHEVWYCSASGAMTFLFAGEVEPLPVSQLCPAFPRKFNCGDVRARRSAPYRFTRIKVGELPTCLDRTLDGRVIANGETVQVRGGAWGDTGYMITKPVTLKAMLRACADLAAEDTEPAEGRVERWRGKLAPWAEQTREFRNEGFYERFPAKGQVERVTRIHRELGQYAGIAPRGKK